MCMLDVDVYVVRCTLDVDVYDVYVVRCTLYVVRCTLIVLRWMSVFDVYTRMDWYTDKI